MQSSLLLPQERVQSIMTGKVLKFRIMLMMKMVTTRNTFEEVSYMLIKRHLSGHLFPSLLSSGNCINLFLVKIDIKLVVIYFLPF